MNIRRLLPKFIRKWQFDRAIEELEIAFAKGDISEDVAKTVDVSPDLFGQCVNIYREYWHLVDET